MVENGGKDADLFRRAFIFQVSKDIGSMACALNGRIDQIIITGGIAYDKAVVAGLKERCGFLAPITVQKNICFYRQSHSKKDIWQV